MNPVDHSLGFQLGRTHRKLYNLLSGKFKSSDVTPEQWSVLCCLIEEEDITQKDLSSRLHKDQPTVTRILDCLDRKGFIVRKPNKADRRSYLIGITDEGRAVEASLHDVEHRVMDSAFQGMKEDEVKQFGQWLALINGNIEKETN
ncbi:MarR family transcriptional regulator [Paenibacillus sp. N1-5-1-14]|uniref:MarR family winged helix-turn-helix transcriptional regulator n=1 Tax=Paenibacillus radicibacter TaxID=2972488 RepID=UPI0021598EBC|nr:MarR family transcriptional regulator [Paenibacillus radicibacter]MCR8642647.1 MarR family transcriptional regulator [Paenibacillus radicibacter]